MDFDVECWEPQLPRNKINGRVSLNQGEDPKLELIGSFIQLEELITKIMLSFDVIIAKNKQTGHFYSLFNCNEISRSHNMTEITSSSITVQHCIQGIEVKAITFGELEEIKFDRVKINIDYLENWISHSGMRIIESGNSNMHPKFVYTPFVELIFELNDFTIKIVDETIFGTNWKRNEIIKYTQNVTVCFEFKEEKSVNSIISDYINHFLYLIMLCLDLNVNLNKVTFLKENDQKLPETREELGELPEFLHGNEDNIIALHKIENSIDLEFPYFDKKITEKNTDQTITSIGIPFNTFKENGNSILTNWFENRENLCVFHPSNLDY